MERSAVNPWPWSQGLGYNQGEVVAGHTRTRHCTGQTATGGDGKPRHAGDLVAQLAPSLDNPEAVLADAGMGLANVVRLTICTTDADRPFQDCGALQSWLVGVAPPTTLFGVTWLAVRELMVEIEGTAVS